MRLLLDTHVLLWALVTPERLPADARDALEDSANKVYFSAANIWEIAIKRALERPDFTVEPDAARDAALSLGFEELPVTGLHAAQVRHLPPLHRDPFDRLLIGQARCEPLLLVTDDAVVAEYGSGIWWLGE